MTSHEPNFSVVILNDGADDVLARVRERFPSSIRLHLARSIDHPALADADVVVTEVIYPPVDAIPKVRLVHLLSAGYEYVPAAYRECPRWVITHGSGPSVVPVAEWCLTMMLHFAHRVRDILAYQSARKWHADRLREFTGSVLRGARLGIVGYGALGQEVGRLAEAFGMQVSASRPRAGIQRSSRYCTPGTGPGHEIRPPEFFDRADLKAVLPSLDYVVLGLRPTPTTRHIINADTLACFRPNAVLINPSRGALVDEQALIVALRERRVAGAALDVFENEPLPADDPLRDAPNVVISPHCSPESTFFRIEIVNLLSENLNRLMAGQPLLNVL